MAPASLCSCVVSVHCSPPRSRLADLERGRVGRALPGIPAAWALPPSGKAAYAAQLSTIDSSAITLGTLEEWGSANPNGGRSARRGRNRMDCHTGKICYGKLEDPANDLIPTSPTHMSDAKHNRGAPLNGAQNRIAHHRFTGTVIHSHFKSRMSG